MKPLDFLQSIAGYMRNAPSDGSTGADNTPPSAKRPIRLATIDPAYSPFSAPYPNGVAPARVKFEGEGEVSGKYYTVATGFIPHVNQRVYLLPVGTTYMIAGAVSAGEAQGFYGGSSTGVEFGDGNYFDVLEGLSLETDADIAGAMYIGGPMDVGLMRLISNEKAVAGLMGGVANSTTTYANMSSPASLSFTKKYSGAHTKLMITLKAGLRVSVGTMPKQVRIGVNISGGVGDLDIDQHEFPTLNHHYAMSGTRELVGTAAGTYTITGVFKPLAASTTVTIDANDWVSLHVREVSLQ